MLLTENKDDNNHSQKQEYCPHDVHDIMMQPNNKNTEPQDFLNHALSEIGAFTQCRLCDVLFYFNFDKQVHISTFDISGDAFASKPNEGMMWFQFVLST